MWNKIYLALLVIGVILLSILLFLTYFQLQSIGFAPSQISENFEYYQNLYRLSLWISSGVLLIVANILLWTNRKAWALWSTFVFFALFLNLQMWWLGEVHGNYLKEHAISGSGLFFGGVLGIFLTIATGIGIFFNQFIVFRMRDKMFGGKELISETPQEITEEIQ